MTWLTLEPGIRIARVRGDDVPSKFGQREPPTAISIASALNTASETMRLAGSSKSEVYGVVAGQDLHCGIAQAVTLAIGAMAMRPDTMLEQMRALSQTAGIQNPNRHVLAVADGLIGLRGRMVATTNTLFQGSGVVISLASGRK